jgi:hypothetical protein
MLWFIAGVVLLMVAGVIVQPVLFAIAIVALMIFLTRRDRTHTI